MTPSDLTRLDAQLQRLHLHHIQSHYKALATKAAEQQRSHLDYLAQLVEGEATIRENRSIERRIKNARFPLRQAGKFPPSRKAPWMVLFTATTSETNSGFVGRRWNCLQAHFMVAPYL